MSSVVERSAPAPAEVRTRRSAAALLQGLVIGLGFVMLVGGFGVIAVNYRPYRIPTASMTPTLNPGDTVLGRKVSGGAVGRGDIVVFHDPLWGADTLVKRVVAVGGDTVACCDAQHRLTVNGTPVDEPYVHTQLVDSTRYSVTVPPGRIFLLGDNRTNSQDSRRHLDLSGGTVAATDVVARVEGTVWPFSRVGTNRRAAAFDGLGGPVAAGAGPLEPAAYGMAGGAVLIVLASAVGGMVSAGRWLRTRRRA
ncbi:signal peptidase I [Kitasatospora kazusensis]|uniref:Signal peptidase I n=1 Tax=Kitasatospora kazusensis TaxID=407974 RepID=A0ABP5LLI7_9ACTN